MAPRAHGRVVAAARCGRGVVINEFSDAAGTGNFIDEFVEQHYDN